MDRAYGQYKSDGQLVNGKASGQAFIKKAPVTDQLWIDHIEGKDPSLGIIPIRDDSNDMESVSGIGFFAHSRFRCHPFIWKSRGADAWEAVVCFMQVLFREKTLVYPI